MVGALGSISWWVPKPGLEAWWSMTTSTGAAKAFSCSRPSRLLGGHVEAEHQLRDGGHLGGRHDQLLAGQEGQRLGHDLRVVPEGDPDLVAQPAQGQRGRQGRAERVAVRADVADEVDGPGAPDLRDHLLPDQLEAGRLGARPRKHREGTLHRGGGGRPRDCSGRRTGRRRPPAMTTRPRRHARTPGPCRGPRHRRTSRPPRWCAPRRRWPWPGRAGRRCSSRSPAARPRRRSASG